MTATEETGQKRSTVIHKLTVHDELPPMQRKPSVLENALSEVAANAPGKWVCIARYESPTAAAGAANNLRRVHGSSPDIHGWKFATRKVRDGDVEHTGLFVQYDKSLVKPGAAVTHQKKLDAWRADQKEKARNKNNKKTATK